MIKLYERRTLIEGINLALKHRLYVSGWCLSGSLVYARDSVSENPSLGLNYSVALYFVNDVPVAICFREYSTLQSFCKKQERNKGYASACVKAVKKSFLCPKDIRADYGIQGSLDFWHKQNVRTGC